MRREWTKEQAEKAYNINKWGEGHFDINPQGFLTVRPSQSEPQIPLKAVVDEMRSQGIELPAVIRFHDILRHRVKTLNTVFRDAMDEANYEGGYYGVYPIKVNQMREVIEEIVLAGERYNFGLEAGSKAELLAAIAYNNNKNALTICNGYKDDDFLKLALLGRRLGRKCIVVIERFSELENLIKLSREMELKPLMGIRAKMSSKGHGRWAESAGESAKFGLSPAEMINAVRLLEKHNLKDAVKLFHFHLGSQVSDIRILKNAITEGARIYVELVKLGLEINYFDAGGGLGVDYDGSRSTKDYSTNYTVEEYASDIIWGLKQVCDLEDVRHPHIVTESGRYISAHHSCVITNVIDTIHSSQASYNTKRLTGEHRLVEDMRELTELLNEENYQEIFNDASLAKDESANAFKLGILSLDEWAKIETLYWDIAKKIHASSRDRDFIPEELQNLEHGLSPQYLCNFSVFQSTADSWAIGQVLPVVPLTRLNEYPTVLCSIADITCDSDGKIDKFIGQQDGLPLHPLNGEEYLVGLFLTGAYQDVMGDMHNLFGRLNEIHVYCDPEDPQGFYLEEIIQGHDASSVLSTMQYNTQYMAQKIKKLVNKEVAKGRLAPRTGVKLADLYENCLRGYTYLNN